MAIGTVKKTRKGIKNIIVDLDQRIKRSFGKPVEQLVEIHYSGQPLSFFYGPNQRIEEISVDIVNRKKNLKKNQDINGNIIDADGINISLDERLSDKVEAIIHCINCNRDFNAILSSHADLSEINNPEFLQRVGDKEILLHSNGGHKLEVKSEKYLTTKVPEESKINSQDFDKKKLKYYKLFTKNPAEVDYLVMYDQNLLVESPQYKYTETRGGEKEINHMILGITIFAWISTIVAIIMFLSSSTTSYSYHVTPHHNGAGYLEWIMFAIVVGAILFIVFDRIQVKSKTSVKYATLSPAPFNVSNRGILPVFLSNSVTQNPFDYVAKTLHISPDEANDVMYSLQRHSWDLLEKTKSGLMFEKMNNTMQTLISESHDLRNYEMMMKQSKTSGYSVQTLIIAALVPVVMTVLIFLLLII